MAKVLSKSELIQKLAEENADKLTKKDVKSVLGNVQRNDALRALVRYSIKQDEKRPEVRVSEQPASSSTPKR